MTTEAPITIKSKLDFDKAEKITLARTVNGVKKKVSIHEVNKMEPELVLRVIDDFDDLSQESRFDLSTGVLRFEKFRECLSSIARDDWDNAKRGKPETEDGFMSARAEFIASMLDEEDFEKQKQYLKTTKKPFSMSVSDYHQRLKFIVSLMKHFPGAPADGQVFDIMALKHIFASAMPQTWKDDYEKSGQTLNTTTWRALVRYFTKCREQSERKIQDSSGGKRKQTFDGPKTKRYGNNNGSGNGQRWKNGKKTKNHSTSSESKDCLFHPDMHSWHMCWGNPSGPKYRKDYTLPPPPANLKFRTIGSRPNSRNKTDAHSMDVDEDPRSNSSKSRDKMDTHYLDSIGEERPSPRRRASSFDM